MFAQQRNGGNDLNTDSIYDKEIICPVCSKKTIVTKVKSKVCKVASRDTDFCVYYEDVNPMLYDIWICENCGYASMGDKFESITTREAKLIHDTISQKWVKRSMSGERSVDSAIEAFKLALLNLQVRKAKSSEFAKIVLRIAWLYRINKDERELDFLRHALIYYNDTYEKERFPVDKLDEFTCMYMIAELNRRLGKNEEAMKWFSRLISSPDARRNTKLLDNARDQIQLIKDTEEAIGQ